MERLRTDWCAVHFEDVPSMRKEYLCALALTLGKVGKLSFVAYMKNRARRSPYAVLSSYVSGIVYRGIQRPLVLSALHSYPRNNVCTRQQFVRLTEATSL